MGHAEAFQTLKNAFIDLVCLKHIIPGVTFRVQTDACDTGIGGVIYQCDENDDHRIISIVGRCLTETETKYTTTERELLAIVYAVNKFRYYLIGVKFLIITDHKGLEFLNSTMYHNHRLIRWSLFLQQFSFDVSYCRGADNIIADFLSRHPEGKFTEHVENKIMISTIHTYCMPKNKNEYNASQIMNLNRNDIILKNIIKNLAEKQKRDTFVKNIRVQLTEKNNDPNYQIFDDILFHKSTDEQNWRIVIPDEIKTELIIATHEKLGHPGVYKTVTYLKTYYFWKYMHRDVKRIVLACDLCQRVKHISTAMEGEYLPVTAECPSELVTVDFYGPLPRSRGGVQYILVVLDAFSKLVRLYSMKCATTQAALKVILEKYVPECGKPNRILSDNGSQFASNKWKNELESKGIKPVYSSIRHPQSNPTERVMRELGRMFRTFCKNTHTEWAVHLKNIEMLLNVTTHYSTAFTPHQLHFGVPVKSEIEKLINFPEKHVIDHDYIITLARENIIKNFNLRKNKQKPSKISLNIGDKVLLRVRHLSNAIDKVTKKFFHLYEGPYTISELKGPNAFVLTDESKQPPIVIGTYSRANLRKYKML